MLSGKAEGEAAFFGSMVIPLIASDGDAVIARQPFLPAGAEKFLPASQQQLLQIHLVGPFHLFFGVSAVKESTHREPPSYPCC